MCPVWSVNHVPGSYRTFPSADALGYLLDASPALFEVVRRILDRLKFPVHATTPRRRGGWG